MRLAVVFFSHSALHVRAGNRPPRGIKVNIGPAHGAQVAGALKQNRYDGQRSLHYWPALVDIAGAQQLTEGQQAGKLRRKCGLSALPISWVMSRFA